MPWEPIFMLALVGLLLVYLIYALINPEKL
ncbi:MAG TPA: K(+)-transporting ATPase subunit F [Parachlamydiaceae bacterium]|nr:K(+)-transporting ATPase subunit F [Parachlamydiaceae bacterium]